jgi:hypothetical protein
MNPILSKTYTRFVHFYEKFRLEVLLKHGTFLRAERHWLPLASIVRYVRNELAHYRPITFRDFEGM